jgi:hypothetical protein
MPKRVVKKFRYESVLEGRQLSPGRERKLWTVPVSRVEGDLARWSAAGGDELEQFYAAPNAVMAAYHSGDFNLSGEIAQAGLRLATQYPKNWNYGNTVHFCHTAQGLLALRQGDVPRAAAELLASVSLSGSPQLNSFGPSMRLARELLKHGERGSVLQFFAHCRTFWSMGARWLDIWEKKVQRGEIPTFAAQGAR